VVSSSGSSSLRSRSIASKHGADPAIKNNDGETPADVARERGNQEIFRLLPPRGAKQ